MLVEIGGETLVRAHAKNQAALKVNGSIIVLLTSILSHEFGFSHSTGLYNCKGWTTIVLVVSLVPFEDCEDMFVKLMTVERSQEILSKTMRDGDNPIAEVSTFVDETCVQAPCVELGNETCHNVIFLAKQRPKGSFELIDKVVLVGVLLACTHYSVEESELLHIPIFKETMIRMLVQDSLYNFIQFFLNGFIVMDRPGSNGDVWHWNVVIRFLSLPALAFVV